MPVPTATPTPGALSVEAWPLVVKASAGHSVHYTATVKDAGTKPIDVSTRTLVLHGSCAKLQFSPAAFNLKPGHEQNVTVTAASGTPTDYLAEFGGTVTGSGKGFGVSAAVGSRLIVGKPATSVTACTAPRAVAPTPDHSANHPWYVIVLAVALLALVCFLIIRKIRGRNAS
jgi:hypothetical protein